MLTKVVQLSLRMVLVGLIFDLTGGHYLLFQTVAWTQMIVAYSKTVPIKEAIKETFDGQHPCHMCKNIQKAKQTEKKQDAIQINLKREFFCQTHGAILLTPPNHFWFQAVANLSPNTFSERPLLQPPRSLLS